MPKTTKPDTDNLIKQLKDVMANRGWFNKGDQQVVDEQILRSIKDYRDIQLISLKFDRKENINMCKVLTQDKSRLIDVSNTDIFIEEVGGKNVFDISVYRYNRSVVLGTYRTKEYAKKFMK